MSQPPLYFIIGQYSLRLNKTFMSLYDFLVSYWLPTVAQLIYMQLCQTWLQTVHEIK